MQNIRSPLIMLFVLAACAMIYAVAMAGAVKQERLTLAHAIDRTGDSASIQKLNVISGVDSFLYVDTVWFGADADTTIVSWLAPLQVRRLRAALDTTLTYACSVDLGTNVYGFEYDCPDGATFNLDSLVDQLVDSFNTVDGMKDTTVTHDSGTYLKVISKFAQLELQGEARWIFVVSSDSLEEIDSTKTTVAMFCDSMAAAFNGEATLTDSLTAINDGDSVVQITGRLGHTMNIVIGDTAHSVAVIQAAKESRSRFTDTFFLFEMYTNQFIDEYTSLWGDITLRASGYTGRGYGLSDSTFLYLFGVSPSGTFYPLGSDSTNSAPLTLHLSFVGNDTLFKHKIALVASVSDTATDSTVTANHILDYEFIVH